MPIDVASYRRWDGRARPTRLATLAIAATMVRRRMRNRLVRMIVFAVAFGASAIASLFFYLSLEGRRNPMLRRPLGDLGLGNVDLLALLNRSFDGFIAFWAVLLAALVGAPLIAEDRRARALPLYFSRAIGHLDYVVGKALSAAFFLALLLLLPRVCMYLVEVAFSEAEGVALRQLPTLLRSGAVGAIGTGVLTAVALGVSSLTERPTHAALLLLGLFALSTAASHTLAAIFDDNAWLALGLYTCVQRISLDFLDVPERLFSGWDRRLVELPLKWAWTSLALWTGAGLAVLFARVRRVEVVT